MLDGTDEVGGVVEHLAQAPEGILIVVDSVLHSLARDSLDAANAGCYRRLRQDADHADAARVADVGTTAEFDTGAELHYAHLVAVLLAEKGNGTHLASLVDRHVAMLLDCDTLTHHLVGHMLHLADLGIGHLLEVAEVEAQAFAAHVRTLLLDMGA